MKTVEPKLIEGWQAMVSPCDRNKPRADGTWEPDNYVPPECQCLVIQGTSEGHHITTSAVVAFDPEAQTLLTRSGSFYRLGTKRLPVTRDVAQVMAEHPTDLRVLVGFGSPVR